MSKSNVNMCQDDILARFDEKIKKLEQSLPLLKGAGINCCELTFTHILDIIGIDNYFFHNCAIPLAGGFGGYKSKDGWQGACGAVCGACMAIGIIMNAQKRMDNEKVPIAYLKAQKYCADFEKEFGSVVCAEACGYDFSTPDGMINYQKNKVWANKCYKFVLWGIGRVKKLMRKELRKNWE